MICDSCKEQDHTLCEDWDMSKVLTKSGAVKQKPVFELRPGRLYRSCDCLHRVSKKAEPDGAQRSAGE